MLHLLLNRKIPKNSELILEISRLLFFHGFFFFFFSPSFLTPKTKNQKTKTNTNQNQNQYPNPKQKTKNKKQKTKHKNKRTNERMNGKLRLSPDTLAFYTKDATAAKEEERPKKKSKKEKSEETPFAAVSGLEVFGAYLDDRSRSLLGLQALLWSLALALLVLSCAARSPATETHTLPALGWSALVGSLAVFAVKAVLVVEPQLRRLELVRPAKP